MELNNITYQPKQLKKTHRIKEHLSQLASSIKVHMDENQILISTINYVCINIKKSRQQLKKFSSNISKENIQSELNKNITHLKSANKNLLTQKKMLFHKYIKLKNKYYTELNPINTELKLLNDRKFIMENIMKRRDFEIKRFELNLELFSAPLVREDKREIFSNNIDNDEDSIIFILEKDQATLFTKSKDFNKWRQKTKELKKEKENLEILLEQLKQQAKTNKIINNSSNEQDIIFKKINQNKNIYLENELSIDNSGLNPIEGEISILSDIMNETINSEYEEEDNTEFLSNQQNYKPIILTPKLRNKIPKINLEQIEYNKTKFKQEYAEKSLSRELKNLDEFDIKKELIKSLIKKEKAKNKRLTNKYLNLLKKINMMKKIINSMKKYNYKLSSNAIRDKKIGNNSGIQFNALSGRGKEMTNLNLKLNYGDNLNFNNEKNSKDKSENIIINKKNNKNVFG